jgi:hypothetical protein
VKRGGDDGHTADTTVWKKRSRDSGTQTTAAPQARPIPRVEWNLPISANPAVFAGFSQRVFLEHMKNTNQKAGDAPGASETKQEKKAPVTKLPRMEMYAVLGLELSKNILEKLQEVEESIEILARQKARELNPDESRDAPGK